MHTSDAHRLFLQQRRHTDLTGVGCQENVPGIKDTMFKELHSSRSPNQPTNKDTTRTLEQKKYTALPMPGRSQGAAQQPKPQAATLTAQN